jgi:hypothetical protein
MSLGGSISITNQLKTGLPELECSAAIFCAIADFPPSRLSQAFSAIKSLGANEEIALKKVFDEMRALQADISAYVGHKITIAWCPAIREVLEDRRTKKNSVSVRSPFTLPGPAVVTPQANPSLIELAVEPR